MSPRGYQDMFPPGNGHSVLQELRLATYCLQIAPHDTAFLVAIPIAPVLSGRLSQRTDPGAQNCAQASPE